jgi:hypothetical protein
MNISSLLAAHSINQNGVNLKRDLPVALKIVVFTLSIVYNVYPFP